MSIALHQQVKQLERDLLEVSRALTDTQSLVKDLAQRLAAIENRPKPGPKPRNG
jgi:septal ring factor EnvC (AmiA/AmiB activator)